MKLRKINILRAVALGTVITFTGCSKDNGAIPERIGIEDVPAVTINLDPGPATAATITFTNQSAFAGKFKAALYFASPAAPTKVDISVRKNNLPTTTSIVTNANVKVFKVDVTSLPASFTITAAEIATLFGTPLTLNDAYDFAPDVYVGTRKYEAFPSASLGSGQGITGMSTIGYGEFVRYSVK